MSKLESKSPLEKILETFIASSVLIVIIGIIILIAQTILNPAKIFQVETLSFTMIFLGIGLISITARILGAVK